MMYWLLKFDGYPPGILIALLLHGLVLYVLLPSEMKPDQFVKVERPPAIAATMSKDNPQRLRRLDQLAVERRNAEAAQRARDQAKEREQAEARKLQAEREAQQRLDAERKQVAEAQAKAQALEKQKQEQAATDARKQEEARQAAAKAEAEKQEQLRQQQVAAEQQRQEEARLQAERQATAQAESLNAETNLIAQYSAIIRQTISNYWSLPPTARNGMTVVVQLQLAGSGEVLDSKILQSSGDPAFDRSALQAVAKADRFPELKDLPPQVFDRNFRNFTLLFRPEDLLR